MRFKYRIIDKEQVYLLMYECAQALGISCKNYVESYPDTLVESEHFGVLVDENAFNKIALNMGEECSDRVQMTRVETLEVRMDDYVKLFPLKQLLAPELLKYQAAEAGYFDLEDYINEYDIPRERKETIERIKNKKAFLSGYSEDLERIRDEMIVNKRNLSECDLRMQHLTIIRNNTAELISYIVGSNCFMQLEFFEDERYTDFVSHNGDIFWRKHYDEDDYDEIKISNTNYHRNFGNYNIFENLLWILNNIHLTSEGEWLHCNKPGVSIAIDTDIALHLLTGRNLGEIVVLPGIIDWNSTELLTTVEYDL